MQRYGSISLLFLSNLVLGFLGKPKETRVVARKAGGHTLRSLRHSVQRDTTSPASSQGPGQG